MDVIPGLRMVDVGTNTTTMLRIQTMERDGWHKIWLYGFVLIHTVMIILIVVTVKVASNENFRRYLPSA